MFPQFGSPREFRAFVMEPATVHASVHVETTTDGHLPMCDVRGTAEFCDPKCPHYNGWKERR
jgi:hypothetical protein